MSILTDLRAALEAKRAANHAFHALNPDETKASDYLDAESESVACDDDLFCLLTDDTIAALVAVAERGARNAVCVCGKVWRYENHHHADDCPLAPLVKEADDE